MFRVALFLALIVANSANSTITTTIPTTSTNTKSTTTLTSVTSGTATCPVCSCEKVEADWEFILNISLPDNHTLVYTDFGVYEYFTFDKRAIFNSTNQGEVDIRERAAWLEREYSEVTFAMTVTPLNSTPAVNTKEDNSEIYQDSAGFTLNKLTGEVLITPWNNTDAKGKYSVTLFVKDKKAEGFTTVTLFEDYIVEVQNKPLFRLRDSTLVTDMKKRIISVSRALPVGNSTEIPMPSSDLSDLFEFPINNDFDNIRFHLRLRNGPNVDIPLCLHVDRTTGTLVATPAVVGEYTATLTANTLAEQEIEIMQWTVTAVAKTFTITKLATRKIISQEELYMDPLGSEGFTIGRNYLIGPLAFTDSEIPVEELQYVLQKGGDCNSTRETVFIEPSTGVLSVRFGKPGNCTLSLFLENRAQVKIPLEEYTLMVTELPPVELKMKDERVKEGSHSSDNNVFVVGQNEPFNLFRKAVDFILSKGVSKDRDLIFSVRNQPSEICFVDQKELRGSLRESVTLEIVAHPLFGDETLAKVVDTIQIIVDSEKFTVTKFEFTETGADHQGKITDVKVGENNVFPLDKNLFLPAISIETSDPDATILTFFMWMGPPGLLMDSMNGQIQGVPREEGEYNVTIEVASGSNVARVVTLPVEIRKADEDLDGIGCLAGTPIDLVPFDGKVECDCSNTTFEGARCDQAASSKKDDDSTVTIVVPILVVVIVTLLLVAAMYRYNQYKESMRAFDFRTQIEELYESGTISSELITENIVPREIKRSHINIDGENSKIGEGEFGEVRKGILDESEFTGGVPGYMVAVKTVFATSGAGADELRREAAVMCLVGSHPNVVSLIGVVTRGAPLLLVISYCEHGSLLSALRKQQDGYGILHDQPQKISKFAGDIARGMQHLAKRKIIHRDLAARNVLLDTTLGCRIADFGLSKGGVETRDGSGYYRSTSGVFPLRWSAVESMESLKFSTATDVWSFGIVLVEIYQFGQIPYKNLDNRQVIINVQKGYRIPQPSNCPDATYKIMRRCWEADTTLRPSFGELVQFFDPEGLEEDKLLEPYGKRASMISENNYNGFDNAEKLNAEYDEAFPIISEGNGTYKSGSADYSTYNSQSSQYVPMNLQSPKSSAATYTEGGSIEGGDIEGGDIERGGSAYLMPRSPAYIPLKDQTREQKKYTGFEELMEPDSKTDDTIPQDGIRMNPLYTNGTTGTYNNEIEQGPAYLEPTINSDIVIINKSDVEGSESPVMVAENDARDSMSPGVFL
eukprot:m.255525 g.255525  ORF g.255525 m.255525 type:complete len:1256 (-) comp16180_c1_seq9:1737-5504(-)